MNPAATSPAVVRFPPRLRVAPAPSAFDALLSAGKIDDRQHDAGLAYAALRRRHDGAKHGGGGLTPGLWQAVKRDHAALLRAAGAERFALDRLCIEGEAPLRSEVERVRAALERL